jgi:general secretion pathway protein E
MPKAASIHDGKESTRKTPQDNVDFFVAISGLNQAKVQELLAFAHQRQQSIMEVLVQRGGVPEARLLKSLAVELSLEYCEMQDVPNADILKLIPAPLAVRQQVLPLYRTGEQLRVATADPLDWPTWDELEHVVGMPLRKILVPKKAISHLLKISYGLGADTVEQIVADRPAATESNIGELQTSRVDENLANEPTVVNFINKVMAEAIVCRASDVHFEPFDTRYRVRYRIDGVLEDVPVPAGLSSLKQAIVSRIKIMSNLDITERRLPQDGRAQISLEGRRYDLRISILPGVFGEAVNVRMQHRQVTELSLSALGFDDQEQEKINALIARPHGLILVTGPTGSGKTTTLYACLQQINTPDTKIITVEDPVEYWMENVVQIQVDDGIGRTFSRALRSILRHDPDIILIGEIRDAETAEIAIRASLTGHLVFATLHTNDAPSAVSRLLDLGVEPFLAASSMIGVMAQRLVRTLCPKCKQETTATLSNEIMTGYEGRGCEACRFTGSQGRTVISEIMAVTPRIRDLIRNREAADRIKQAATAEGMRTLRERAVTVVREGRTSPSEMLRVTEADD